MLKKIIPMVISLCMLLSASVMAENVNPEKIDAVSQATQMPQGEPGDMQMPPEGNFAPPEGNMQNREMPPEGMGNGQRPQMQGENAPAGGRMPGNMGGFGGNMQAFNQNTQEEQPMGFLGFVKTYSTPICSLILLGLAFIFVIFYRRKNY